MQQNVLYTDFISIDAQELPVNHLGGLALPVLGDLFRHLPTLKKCFFSKVAGDLAKVYSCCSVTTAVLQSGAH